MTECLHPEKIAPLVGKVLRPRLARVTVHVDPCDHRGRDHHEEVSHHDERSTLIGAHRHR